MTPDPPAQALRPARRRFEDRVAWVSGAVAGIGRATAVALAREGAPVVVVDIDEQGLAETVARYGRFDVAFNNAGIEQTVAPVHQIDLAD